MRNIKLSLTSLVILFLLSLNLTPALAAGTPSLPPVAPKPTPTVSTNPNDACIKALFPATSNLSNVANNNIVCTDITKTLVALTNKKIFSDYAGNIAANLFLLEKNITIIKKSKLTESITKDQNIVLSKILIPTQKTIKSLPNIKPVEENKYNEIIKLYFSNTLKVSPSDIATMYSAVGTLKLSSTAKNGDMVFTSTKDKSIKYTFSKNRTILSAVLNNVTYQLKTLA